MVHECQAIRDGVPFGNNREKKTKKTESVDTKCCWEISLKKKKNNRQRPTTF